ncbi:hypothetical protein CCZ01_07365 [Helicobacter monodelphidis]|uniref:MG2 domain-containing protein n=1 Tax=Helicobacter sp. 15-1451 TaxID=2004995 RepID=UPI000DCF15D3|nr:MG2 domain-containing protein [Helicobacter sp. 15-1451]RAX57057.1 hypothetical protein CCZ01_07365 [Helicobacter sp. 15-1451]
MSKILFLRVFFGFVFAILFVACSSEIEVNSVKQIDSNLLEIVLKEPVAEQNINTLYDVKDILVLEHKGSKVSPQGKYAWVQSDTLRIYLKDPLIPNQDYKITLDLASISKITQSKPLAQMQTTLTTPKNEFSLSQNEFVFSESDPTIAFLQVEFEVAVPIMDIQSGISIQSPQNEVVPFTLETLAGGKYRVISDLQTSSYSQDLVYRLKFDAQKLGLEENLEYDVTLHRNSSLNFLNLQVRNSVPAIELYFSQPIDIQNLENYLRISPETTLKISSVGNKIILNGDFKIGTTYNLDILAGIKGLQGEKLKENVTQKFSFTDLPPQIAFSNEGALLPANHQHKIAFKTLNVNQVHVRVSQIYLNNLTQFFYDQDLIGGSRYSGYDITSRLSRLGDTVFEGDFDIQNVQNQWQQNEIDLTSIKNKKGIFVVELSFKQESISYQFPSSMEKWKIRNYFIKQGRVGKHLVFTDMSILAQRSKDKLYATLLDITSNKPIPGVEIEAYNSRNQLIAKATTNNAGDVILPSKDIYYLFTQRNEDVSALKLSAPLSNDGFDVGGISPQDIRAFLYTDRGVYRPGESIHLSLIARNKNSLLPAELPILLTLTNPRGKETLVDLPLKQSNEFGFYNHTIEIPQNAPTGLWNVNVKIGDTENFNKTIPIETIVPYRIAVELDAQDTLKLSEQENTLAYQIHSKYLFGAPASNLDYRSSLSVIPSIFHSKKYPDYRFENPTSYNYNAEESQKGTLDENGDAHSSFQLNSLERANSNLEAKILTQVFERGGRGVSARKSISIQLYDHFVGVQEPNSRYIQQNSPLSLPVVVLSADDTPVAGRKISYKIYHNRYSWWWDYSSYSSFIAAFKSDRNSQLIAEGELTSKDQPIFFTYTPSETGEIFIEFTDIASKSSTGTNFYVSSWGEPTQENKIISLKITADKEEYQLGEEAKVYFESAKGAKALVSISSQGEILQRYWIDTIGDQTELNIPITQEMLPNAYVSVSLLQNYQTSSENDRPLRLYGVVPLNVVDENTKLNLQILAKDEILPDSTLEVVIKNPKKEKFGFSLAVVDEGLLALNAFKTPNAWDYFFAKQSLGIETYDLYDLIIKKRLGEVSKVFKAGGEEAYFAKQKGDENAERFKPVAFFISPTTSDENGEATFRFDIPNYMGKLRVMVVASQQELFGSAQKEVIVNAPVVMLPTIPRSLKVGDSFSLPIELIPTQDDVGKVTLQIRSGEKIVFEQTELQTRFEGRRSQILNFKGKVQESIGTEEIVLTLMQKGSTLTDKTEIDIKAINPYVTKTQSTVIQAGENTTILSPTDFIKHSNEGHLIVSSYPILMLDHRLRFLIQYPYGCIEQTTSAVLPQLFMDKLSHADFINKERIAENIRAAIAKLQSFQTGDGGFAYWQGQSDSNMWGSNYAGHFMILAKKVGFYVPDSLFLRWVDYQTSQLRNEDSPYKAYSVYLLALAGKGQMSFMNELYENQLDSLNVVDKWFLAGAYQLLGYEDIAKTITKNLSQQPDDDSQYNIGSYGSNTRNRAIILQIYHSIYKDTPKALYQDLKAILESESWLSTQTTSYLLLSFAMLEQEGSKEGLQGSVSVNGTQNTLKNPLESYRLDSGEAKIQNAGKQPIYVNYIWEGITKEKLNPIYKGGLGLAQSFWKEDGSALPISELKQLKSSTSFWIRFVLTNDNNMSEFTHIALTQGLPSGWEIENTRLNDDSLPSFVKESQSRDVTYVDIRDDKIMWFFDNIYDKKVVWVKINTVTPGSYILPPAFAEAMYNHNIQGSVAEIPVEVLPQ